MSRAEAKYKFTAEDRTKAAVASVKGGLGGMDRAVGLVRRNLAGLAAALSIGAMMRWGREIIQEADEVQKLSQRLGVSTQALSEYNYVAKITGVEQRTLTMGWQRMTRRVAEAAQGLGEARGALAELNLDAERLSKLTPDRQFEAIADAIAEIENPADRVRLAMKLFDSEGVALIQTMQGGSSEMQKLREEARRLGYTFSQEDAEALELFNDNLIRVKTGLSGIALEVVNTLGPALGEMVRWLSVSIPDAVDWVENAWIDLARLGARYDDVMVSATASIPVLSGLAVGYAQSAQAMRDYVEELERGQDERREERLAHLQILLGLDEETRKRAEIQRMMKEGEALTRKMMTADEAYAFEINHINDLLELGAINLVTYHRRLDQLTEEFIDTGDTAGKAAQTIQDRMAAAAAGMDYAFTRAILNVREGLGDLWNYIVQTTSQELVSHYITDPLSRSLTSAIAGGGGNTASGGVGGGISGGTDGVSGGLATQGNQAGGTPIIYIQAVDTQSFAQALYRNRRMIKSLVMG